MTSSSFDTLVRDYLKERYDESPTWASMLGLTEYDEHSEDLSAEAFRRRDEEVVSWIKRLRAVGDAELNPAERIDRDAIIASLRGRELMSANSRAMRSRVAISSSRAKGSRVHGAL